MTLLTRIRRALGIQRRSSTHLTAAYEKRRTAQLRKAREAFARGARA